MSSRRAGWAVGTRGAAARVACIALALLLAAAPGLADARECRAGHVYLTLDTGWSREAEDIAATLRRHGVRATLFVANEPTHRGDRQLEPSWAAFWQARAAEGHVFATHTWRHWYFTGDPAPGRVRHASRRGEGAEVLDQAALCAELNRPIEALRALAPEAQVLPLWRAPGGITTPNAVAMARSCGFAHQGWSPEGFWGDELDARAHPNAVLARRAVSSARDGTVVVLHWGVRSRTEPFARVLDEVLTGLAARGFCFATLPPEGRR